MAPPQESYKLWFEEPGGKLTELYFDRIDVEEHEAPTEVTEFPVEEGADINDNARPGVKKLRLEGYVSNKPLPSNLRLAKEPEARRTAEIIKFEQTTLGGHRPERLNLPQSNASIPIGPGAVTSAIYSALDSLDGPTVAQLVTYLKTPTSQTAQIDRQVEPVDRVLAMQEKLNDIWENSRILHVATSLEYYTDMVIENRMSSRRKQDGSGATFSLDLKKVNFVKSESVSAPNPSIKVSLGSRAVVPIGANASSYEAKLKALRESRPDAFGDLINRVP